MTEFKDVNESILPEDIEEHSKFYNEPDLFQKLKSLPRSAVSQVLERALLLRELLFNGSTPLWARGTILGALGYLILPLDVIPDFLPGVGFIDDIALMGLVLANLDNMVTEEIRQKVKKKISSDSPLDDTRLADQP